MRYVKPPTMDGLDALVAVSLNIYFSLIFYADIEYSFSEITYHYMYLFVQKKKRKQKDKEMSGNVC